MESLFVFLKSVNTIHTSIAIRTATCLSVLILQMPTPILYYKT